MTKPIMQTQRDKAALYDTHRNIAGSKGYSSVGEALDALPKRA